LIYVQDVVNKSLQKSEVLKETSDAVQQLEALQREVASWKQSASRLQMRLDSVGAEHRNQLQEVAVAKH
jgi:hypothetical protein